MIPVQPVFPKEPVEHNEAQQPSKVRSALKSLFKEFLSHSTIHGMNYIGMAKSALEHLWWMTVFVLSVAGCGLLIQQVYHKWDENPVIVSFDEQPTPVWKIPFPAVTICPEAQIKTDLFNFTECLHTEFHSSSILDQARQEQLMAVLQLCDSFFHTFKMYTENYPDVSPKIVSMLKNLSVTMEDTIKWCNYGKTFCREAFFQTLTDNGICYTYNGLSMKDMFNDGVLHGEYEYLTETKLAENWTLEDGHSAGSPYLTHPARATGPATRYHIKVGSRIKDIESYCKEEQGFKLVLHSPDEYPVPSLKYVLLPLEQDITVALRPQILTTAKVLHSYTPKRRRCFFNNERKLKFFRYYNQNNCEVECLTNHTLATCGCVKFSMPRTEGTRVCGTPEMRCVLDAQSYLIQSLAKIKLKETVVVSKCNCMQACSTIEYQTEITQSKYNSWQTLALRSAPIVPNATQRVDETQTSKITIYFKGDEFLSMRRGELFGLTDFIANCGGILGLCLGFSLFSTVELAYYFIAKPVLLIRNSRKTEDNKPVW
ncbi:hypothetical protein quinque_005771 [Culex quinquefasciatus]